LFEAYVVAKQRDNILDYDDLLLYWRHAMAEPAVATEIRGSFDRVLVDEYQDTNRLQAEILMALRPDGSGLTIVGDDVPIDLFVPRGNSSEHSRLSLPFLPTRDGHRARAQLPLDPNDPRRRKRSNRQGPCADREDLYSTKASAERPFLANVEDEAAQPKYVADSVLEHREAGIALRRQAVLFRTAHHSDLLEIELGRRNIPSSNMAASDFSRPLM
jgi:DNA helicase-2/ATP-dependent DNA helicase PcrA